MVLSVSPYRKLIGRLQRDYLVEEQVHLWRSLVLRNVHRRIVVGVACRRIVSTVTRSSMTRFLGVEVGTKDLQSCVQSGTDGHQYQSWTINVVKCLQSGSLELFVLGAGMMLAEYMSFLGCGLLTMQSLHRRMSGVCLCSPNQQHEYS